MIEKEREGEREREYVVSTSRSSFSSLLLLLLLQNLGERKRNETKSIKQNRKQQNRTISEWNPFLVQFFPRYPRERFNRGDYRRRRGRQTFLRSQQSPVSRTRSLKFASRSSTTTICATALSLCVCPVATHSTSMAKYSSSSSSSRCSLCASFLRRREEGTNVDAFAFSCRDGMRV